MKAFGNFRVWGSVLLLALAIITPASWAQAASHTIAVTASTTSGPNPEPVTCGEETTAGLTASANISTVSQEALNGGPTWTWSVTAKQARSSSNGQWAAADCTATISPSTSSSPAATFTGKGDPSYWKITCTVTVTYADANDSWSGSDTVDVLFTSVGVLKLQYKNPTNFVDAQSTAYVVTGTQMTFQAIATPEGAPWPTAKPTWTGATGTGGTATATFSSRSADLDHPLVVTATCGTSNASTNVLVCDLSAVRTPQDNFQNRSTTRYGVGEVLDLSFTTSPVGITAAQLGGLEWIQIIPASGDGVLHSDPANNGTGAYTCPDTLGAAGTNETMRVQVLAGPSEGMGANSPFTVVPPFDIVYEKIGQLRHYQGHPSCGFLAYVYLKPVDVSFHNCAYSEDACPAVLNGWFAIKYPDGAPHNPNPNPVSVSTGDANNGCKVNGADQIYSGWCDPPPPLSAGTFTWNIPQRYKVGSGNWHVFVHSQQQWTLDSMGTVTIGKHNEGPYSADMNDPDSSW